MGETRRAFVAVPLPARVVAAPARVRKPLLRQGLSYLDAMLEEPAREYGAIPVDEVRLFRSDLTPRGARHTILERAHLEG